MREEDKEVTIQMMNQTAQIFTMTSIMTHEVSVSACLNSLTAIAISQKSPAACEMIMIWVFSFFLSPSYFQCEVKIAFIIAHKEMM